MVVGGFRSFHVLVLTFEINRPNLKLAFRKYHCEKSSKFPKISAPSKPGTGFKFKIIPLNTLKICFPKNNFNLTSTT